MLHKAKVEAQAESLLDLLIDQCADLEALLQLARRENEAVEQEDFAALLGVVSARAELSGRLEVHQRQIAEMRERLGETAEAAFQSEAARRAAGLANSIMVQDESTRPMLVAARDRAAAEARMLEQKRRGLSAYLPESRRPAIACDQLA